MPVLGKHLSKSATTTICGICSKLTLKATVRHYRARECECLLLVERAHSFIYNILKLLYT